MDKKGFTLIELLAVIVILAIIALIVTPIVTSIISSARQSANARSVEGHMSNINYAIITAAFNGSGDVSIYDGTITAVPAGLTIPDNDKITCTNYTIKNGVVTAATGCTASGWANNFSYSSTTGAAVQ